MLNGMNEPRRLKRFLLKDQGYELLREFIIGGNILPGTKLVEREVAQMLGISRAPARDALIQLEQEGLVISKPNGRHVVEPSERDVRELYQLRRVLERLAVELAVRNISVEDKEALLAGLRRMEAATAEDDYALFEQSDLAMHRLIWKTADNRHLMRALRAMLGPIFMFDTTDAERIEWQKTLQSNREIVKNIVAGNAEGAAASMEEYLQIGLDRAILVLRGYQEGLKA